MTLRQVWRFFRDCQIIGPDCTIAQFDRLYTQGRKNHFSLVPKKIVEEVRRNSTGRKKFKDPLVHSSEEDEAEESKKPSEEIEDIHFPQK